LIPKRRGTNTDPHYSIGMMVVILASTVRHQGFLSEQGVIVGWSKVPDAPRHIYHLLVNPRKQKFASAEHLTPVIVNVFDGGIGMYE